MPEHKTLAIPLRKVDFSETSQVLRLLTKDLGKITAIARGSKRRKGTFQGAFDQFIEYEVVRIPKPEERLGVLTSAVPRRDFPRLRSDLDAFYLACYASELVDALTADAQPASAVYGLYAGFLQSLQDRGAVPLDLFRYEARLLRELGFQPRLLACGGCRRKVAQSDAWFSPADGGAICVRCGTRDPGAFRLAARVLYAAANLSGKEVLPEEHYRRLAGDLRRLLDAHIRRVAERDFKSLRFVREICAAQSAAATPDPGSPPRRARPRPRPRPPTGATPPTWSRGS